MSTMELLAPAGDMEALKLAVFHGANAVYLGVKEFNARNNIEGFTLNSLKDAVDFAHLYNVKVYLTENILFKDEELQSALDLIFCAHNMGVDAFIIQDLGLAKLIKEHYCDVEIHASTQMGVHNLEGVKICEKLGFSRVVLSRETSLEEIKRIKQNSKMEIEMFCQGALCVSFSGNCYMCSHLVNKSGNRGLCQQFCRLPYEFKFNDKEIQSGYLLSCKDVCLLPYLKELKDIGIDSLKIEGRARRPFYVAETVRVYRKVLDNNFKYSQKDIDDLKLAFNREYTPLYFEGNSAIISKCQSHIGVKIGTVSKFVGGKNFNEIYIDTKYNLSKKSAIKIFRNQEEICTISTYDLNPTKSGYKVTTTNKAKVNDQVNIIVDADKENEVLNYTKKLNAHIEIKAYQNEPISLIAKCENCNISIKGNVLEKAKTSALSCEEVIAQFNKNDLFNFTVDFDTNGVFLRKAELNNLRREIIEKLKEKILKKYLNINKIKIIENKSIIKQNTYNKAIKFNFSIINKIKDCKLKNINLIYSPDDYCENNIKLFAEYCLKNNCVPYLDLPNFAEEKDIEILKNLVEKYSLNIVANNLYALFFPAEKIIAGQFLNIYNLQTINCLKKFGIYVAFVAELTEEEIKILQSKTDVFLTKIAPIYMTLKYCPIKTFVGGNCANCKYKDGYTFKMKNGKTFALKRKKVFNCNFYLEDKND